MTGTINELPAWLDVSRETLEKLREFRALIERWNPAINLVSRGGLEHVWDRHILDSAQLFNLKPEVADSWVDLGSGGGFPGVIIAILAEMSCSNLKVTLVESDRRKAAFLSQSVRVLGLDCEVEVVRIEDLEPRGASVISARALAPLVDLIGHAKRHLATGGTAIFPKGAGADQEVAAAHKKWKFDLVEHQSQTSPSGRILVLKDIADA